ncbi:hypothetical protein AWB71_02794 [Caballeronia peredens]|nr:hypothetical protein AWB71_02794 [Caballeronia peredens]
MTTLHVAVRRKNVAARMLEKKKAVLEQWLVDGVPLLVRDDGTPVLDGDGERQLDYFPSNIAALADWDGTQNCGPTRDRYGLDLTRTGRMTIDQPYHARMKEQLRETIKALEERATKQKAALNKVTEISILREKLSHAEALIKQQNKEIASFQVRRRSLELKYKTKTKSLAGAKLEHQRVVQRLEGKIADLTALLRKVTSLKVSKREA